MLLNVNDHVDFLFMANVPSAAKSILHIRCHIVSKTAVKKLHFVMEFDRSNKFDIFFTGLQVNLLRLNSSVASK